MAQILHLRCKASAALLPNNLTASDNKLAYVHGGLANDVYLLNNKPATFQSGNQSASVTRVQLSATTDRVNQLRYVNVFGRNHLVLTFGRTVNLFNEAGSSLVSFHTGPDDQLGFSGIASDGKSNLYLGHGNGNIYAFAGALASPATLAGHSSPVTCIDVNPSGTVMASADESGTIHIREGPAGQLFGSSKTEFKGDGYPVTGLRVRSGLVIASYSTGHLRFFDVASKKIKAELAAHTRNISALDVHPSQQQVAVASEDAHLSVWSFPTGSAQVRKLKCVDVGQSLVTGVSYVANGAKIALTTYDSRYVLAVAAPSC